MSSGSFLDAQIDAFMCFHIAIYHHSYGMSLNFVEKIGPFHQAMGRFRLAAPPWLDRGHLN
jgi:hypothetical protein